MDEAEVYSIFKASPLLTESTKLIAETSDGISATEIAETLHKREPTIHRALQRLRPMSLVTIRSEGKRKVYRIVPGKKEMIERLLAKLYYPTRAYVIGELHRGSLAVSTSDNEEVKGKCFIHKMDLVYSHERSISLVEDTRTVGVIVLDNLAANDIFALGGKLLDLHDGGEFGQGYPLDGILIVVIEDGSTRKSFSELEHFLEEICEKLDIDTNAILIEKKSPRTGIDKAQSWAASVLAKD